MSGIKLRAVGTSTGVVLPKQMLHRLKIWIRTMLSLLLKPPDGYLLTPYDPEFDEQLRIGLEFMAEYRDIFRALAK